jgi:DNA-binding MurR/RpiR family transcriptional regulator
MLTKLIKQTDFTPNEEILNEYVLKNIENVIYMTIYELSQETYTSVSTIVRYCKKFDVAGFKEFKIELTKSLTELGRDTEENFRGLSDDLDVEDNSFMNIAHNVAKVNAQTIEETFHFFDEAKLYQSIDLILKAKNIYAIGVSDPYLRLQHFQIKLLKLGIRVQMISLQPEQFYLAHFSEENDLAILVSHGGQTAEILNDARLFHKNKTPILSITSNTTGYLAEVSTVVLPIPKVKADSKPQTLFASQIAIEYVLNVLYSLILKESNIEVLKNTPISQLRDE